MVRRKIFGDWIESATLLSFIGEAMSQYVHHFYSASRGTIGKRKLKANDVCKDELTMKDNVHFASVHCILLYFVPSMSIAKICLLAYPSF
jgi:hypothetical protein